MDRYKKRIADKILSDKLEAKGAVLIQGAKWCGKTTTASQQAKSILYMQNPRDKKQNMELAQVDPGLLLEGKTPRLIDEWQIAPQLWDAIRFEVDQRDAFQQFILTGSSVPANMDFTSHSGTGRITRMLMRPMSLYESEESNGSVSLKELFEGKKISTKSDLDIKTLAYLICRGGWPKAVGQSEKIALSQAYDYLDAVIESDISQVDGVIRNPLRARLLMKAFSRYIGSPGKVSKIRQDMCVNDSEELSDKTIYDYINALKRIFVIEDLSAWNPNLRSKTAIRTSDTRYFVDPSIAVAALRLGPQDLLYDLHTFSFLFENLCIRDLRVFADALDGDLYHYRDKSGLECDAVLHLRNGRYGLIEVKLGGNEAIEDGARNLLKLREKIDTDKMKEPSFMMVLCGTSSYAYQREDGVYVIPIGCLKD